MKIYSRNSRAALRYHFRIIAAIIVLQPQMLLAADIEPPISEDHWPKAHVYMPMIGREAHQ